MNDVLVSGWYGNGNVGDEAVLAGLALALRQAKSDFSVDAFSATPAIPSSHSNVRFVARGLGIPASQTIVQATQAVRHRMFVLGGGGLLKDLGSSSANVERWVGPMRLAQRFGRTTMTYAVGVEELRRWRSREMVRQALGRCELITVREPASKRLLEEIGIDQEIVVTADPALLLGAAPASSVPVPAQRRGIIVSMRHWYTSELRVSDPRSVNVVHAEVAAALDRIVMESDQPVTFLPFRTRAGDDDRVPCRDVMARMRYASRASLVESASLDEVLARYAAAEFVVGMRLHSVILAAAAGVPCSAIGYMPKVGNFLEHARLSQRAVHLTDTTQSGTVANTILAAFAERERTTLTMRRSVPLLRSLAAINGELLVALALNDRDALHAQKQRVQTILEQLSDVPPG